jgi:hypothetical protein
MPQSGANFNLQKKGGKWGNIKGKREERKQKETINRG